MIFSNFGLSLPSLYRPTPPPPQRILGPVVPKPVVVTAPVVAPKPVVAPVAMPVVRPPIVAPIMPRSSNPLLIGAALFVGWKLLR